MRPFTCNPSRSPPPEIASRLLLSLPSNCDPLHPPIQDLPLPEIALLRLRLCPRPAALSAIAPFFMLACWARDRANSEIFYSCHGDVELQMFSPFGIFKLQATGTPLRSLALRRLVRAESHGRRLSYRKPAPVKAVSEAWTEPERRNTLNRLDGKIVALSVDRGRGQWGFSVLELLLQQPPAPCTAPGHRGTQTT